MAAERFYIERRHGPKDYSPLGGQPANGFPSVKAAIGWLAERGWITHRIDEASGEPFWQGWGGERGFYCKAVPVRIGDFPTPQTTTLADSRAEHGTTLRIPLEVRELPHRGRAWRSIKTRLRRT